MNRIFVTSIETVYTDHELNRLAALMSKERIKKISGFRFREDYLRSLLGEVMLRIQAGNELGVNPEVLIIERDENGKPYFKDFPYCHFSISHSGDWVVCMLSDQNCGIDIEKVGDVKNDIARRFFTERENEMIMAAVADRQNDIFYDLWTLKESYMKFDGRGLQMGLKNVEFELCGNEYHLVSDDQGNYIFKQFDLISGYKISMCALEPEYEVRIVSLKEYIMDEKHVRLSDTIRRG